tara:strand:- start:202 stop:552 length:351 start_codon:yes stop_codon:yes gene_type:complete
MAAEKRQTYFGVPVKTWDKIELASLGVVVATAARGALDTVGSKGVFGYGKSSKLVKASRFGLKKSTWSELNTLSTVLGFMLLAKSAIDTLERKTDLFKKEISPGEGFIPWQYRYRY